MNEWTRIALGWLLACLLPGLAQGQARWMGYIQVEAGRYDRVETPLSLSLAGQTWPAGMYPELRTAAGEGVPVHRLADPEPRLLWRLPGRLPAGRSQIFSLWAVSDPPAPAMQARDDGTAIALQRGHREILRYVYAETPAPAGVTDRYARGGYIHPLRTPSGMSLTQIQPPDHYHHYGLWHPWTHTAFRGREVDFWNLYKAQGTVRPLPPVLAQAGPVVAQVEARQVHEVFADTTRAQVEPALYEQLQLRLWAGEEGAPAVLDVQSTQRCASEVPLTLLTYRYQGFTLRGPETWGPETATILTSAGHSQVDANGTRARWVMATGPGPKGPAGTLLLSAPDNYNHPQPVRIWPPDANGGQDNMFINFNPTMDRDWELVPGQTYGLRYRVVTFDGQMDSLTAEAYWHDWADPPQARLMARDQEKPVRLLAFAKNGPGYVHANIPTCLATLRALGEAHGFVVDTTRDASWFTPVRLATYDAILFANSNNAVFDEPSQREALQGFVRQGGGVVGIHIACGTERDWPWFAEMIGGKFQRHPPFQAFEMEVLDPNHPSTAHLPARWAWEDECYIMTELNPATHTLLAADLRTVEDPKREPYPGRTFGDRFPLSWCQTFDGGRQWFTALGHATSSYLDPVFQQHLLGGIWWVLAEE
ncbi:MAG: hypothetical protein D6722_09585 [Bacteroidetes bacterium]|nr:MAG: hypothetical protein D6722_09585 [Bacteroidota bacterium]